jgi:hypothetical protein
MLSQVPEGPLAETQAARVHTLLRRWAAAPVAPGADGGAAAAIAERAASGDSEVPDDLINALATGDVARAKRVRQPHTHTHTHTHTHNSPFAYLGGAFLVDARSSCHGVSLLTRIAHALISWIVHFNVANFGRPPQQVVGHATLEPSDGRILMFRCEQEIIFRCEQKIIFQIYFR